MPAIGVNIGALTVKVVSLDGDRVHWRVVNHQGGPLEAVRQVLREFPTSAFVGVSGHLGHISEVAALEAALAHVAGPFDAVASLGGETFALYVLQGQRILTVLSHNKCAAGSGEFLAQQIARLGLSMEEATARSFQGKLVPLASRCSVHCKSDITHKLNRHEASIEDVLHTLHDALADKVVSLLDKTGADVHRLLLAGGLSQNRALLAALCRKLPQTEVVVLPESAYLEALGTAWLTQAEPLYDHPHLTVRPSLDSLPALKPYGNSVRFLGAQRRSEEREERSEKRAGRAGPHSSLLNPHYSFLVLGVDVGSTTTKAVLLDARTRAVVAWHYGRTSGDPVGACRECLRRLVAQVGNRPVSLIATTGSAREVVGAYLGTAHVYNEISAHAAGATHFAPDVDTLFEIGGQDAKYIFLRNGVPVDYAMNASCSAGTGSFLEECAQGDLGLALNEISDAALRSERPVHFKATCAAFISSDVRTAMQEGHGREDIAAGLVYAVAWNYLCKVKGPRAVGRKVFLQGGVAMNRAVAHAFAQCLGKPILVPPHPELMGAVGVALLALEQPEAAAQPLPMQPESGVSPPLRDLAALASSDLSRGAPFVCHGCDNQCEIEQFEVAGRRFPFGGRCSRFENLRRRRPEGRDVPDLVEARNRLIFAPVESGALELSIGGLADSALDRKSKIENRKSQIGIPRALTAHSLYPLYATFFSRLGFEPVLSGVDPAGWLKAYSGFCFPVQIAHGAVLDLVKRGLDRIFLPHVSRMPNHEAGRDSYLCPITQAAPYFMSKAFPGVAFLSPVLSFAQGYETCTGLADMACEQLGVSRAAAAQAYGEAVQAQVRAEQAMQRLGQEALEAARADGQPTVILVGRSYNAFSPEASQSVGRKLASMGVRVVPGDCLPPVRTGPTAWHYPNVILNAVALAREHANLFLVYVSNFSCTIDAFTHAMLPSELGAKPYLMLEIDAHTADAGTQTRLEAFRDIIARYRPGPSSRPPFQAAAIGPKAVVTTSAGEHLDLADPRVKIHFPTFSYYHGRAIALAARWMGLHVGPVNGPNRRQLERGLQHTSGSECLPLPICIGQMLEAHAQRRPGEVVGFYMVRGGAPCVVDRYLDYFHQFIESNALEDLFIFDPQEANEYYGMSYLKMGQSLAQLLTLADLFVEMEQSLRVVGAPGSLERLKACWETWVDAAPSLKVLRAGLERLVEGLAAIPHTDPTLCPKVIVTGDFFTRFTPSFMEGVHDLYARHGIILVSVGLNELLLYAAYAGMALAAEDWGLAADSPRAAARACFRLFQPDGKAYLASWTEYHRLKYYDTSYHKLLQRTSLLVTGLNDIAGLFQHARAHLSPAIVGEAIPTVGRGVAAGEEGYQGIIAIGPFNCLPFRISEAILKPHCLRQGMPILTYESDGFSVSPAFLQQAELHIQQVLACRTPAKQFKKPIHLEKV